MRQGDATLPYPNSTIIDSLDVIDPESVTFEPLQQTINGAAITDLSAHSSDDDVALEYPADYMYASSTPLEDQPLDSDYSSVVIDDNDDSSPIRQGSEKRKGSFFGSSSGYFQLGQSNSSDDDSDYDSSKGERKSPLSFIMDSVPHPLRLMLTKAMSDKSLVAAISIVMAGAFMLIVSSIISRSISHLAGIGPEGHIATISRRIFYNSSNKVSPQGRLFAPPVGTEISSGSLLDNFADVDDVPLELLDTPVFWHVPRSAGTSTKGIFAKCLGKVVATEVGGLDGHNLDEQLETIKKPNGIFVNVDTYTIPGIEHATKMGMVQSNMAEIIFTPFVHESAMMFDTHHRGRLFTMLRDPVERVMSLYYFLRMYDSRVESQSLEEFVTTSGENWMVRTLVQQMSGPIDDQHLNMAKEVLRRKFLIGLVESKTESFRRFEQYFGWNVPSPFAHNCKNNILYFEFHVKNPHPNLEVTDPIWERIASMNMYDIQLYEYALQLFEEQGNLFAT